ncbi:hypothetical protein ABPG74_012372 [Tetrahymena malaccensis]
MRSFKAADSLMIQQYNSKVISKASIMSQETSSSSYYSLEYLFKLAFEKCILISLGVSFKRQTGLSSYWNYISV